MNGVLKMARCVAVWILLAGFAPANAETFDRSTEVNGYIDIMTNGTRGAAVEAAKRIYISGIDDPRLAAAINERLMRDYADLVRWRSHAIPTPADIVHSAVQNVDEEYGVWLIRALASTGIVDYDATLEQISQPAKAGGPNAKKLRANAKKERTRLAWYKGKNDIMASKANYQEGADPYASMMINLLLSSDVTYRDYALDNIRREKLDDERIWAVLVQQIDQYLAQTSGVKNKAEDNLAAEAVVLLGLTSDRKYRDTLDKVMASNAAPGVKKHAQNALRRLE